MQLEQQVYPWYKEFCAWFCIGILVLAVVLGLGLLTVAINNPPSIVVDNYYDVGKGINKSLERERLAKQLGMRATLTLNLELEQVELQLEGKSLPQQLVLNIISPTQPEQDRRVVLQPVDTNGLYRGLLGEPVLGKRFVELLGQTDGQEWRLFEEEKIEPGQRIELGFN